MEPGLEPEAVNEIEVEEFWRGEQVLELDPAPCLPEAQEPDDYEMRQTEYKRQQREKTTPPIQKKVCRTHPWTPDFDSSPAQVDRVWVYRHKGRSYLEEAVERLFVVFAKPFGGGLDLASDLVSISQSGRWEFLNPRTLCFAPAGGKVTASQVIIHGVSHSVWGGENS